MLVLSRKINEAIIINDNIRIVVVEIRGDKVRLGVEAPKDISVSVFPFRINVMAGFSFCFENDSKIRLFSELLFIFNSIE